MSKDPQQGIQNLTMASISSGSTDSIPRVGNSWATPIAVNKSYRLDLAGPQFESLTFEVFDLASTASVILVVSLSNTAEQIQVQTADQSLQLGQQLPSNPEASAAAYDANSRTLSLLFFGTASSQTQVCIPSRTVV